MNSETEFTPNNTGYPDPFDSSEPGSSEEGENEDEDGDSNNQQNRLSLQIVTNGEDSFYLVNVGSTAVPLSSFRFVEGNKTFEGSLWGLDSLAPGQCVSVWKDKGNPSAPDVSCNEVGGRLEQKAKDLFWKKNFDVFFRNNFVTTCSDTGCQFVLPS
jgi:hypothetical protein